MVRTYQFRQDGSYSYSQGTCMNKFDASTCQMRTEDGLATVADGLLTLEPTANSVAGSRSYSYAVQSDPYTSRVQLRFFTSQTLGYDQVFYQQ